MAQSVRTVITDDLDDSELDPANATTVRWSWRGVTYEFDTRTETLAGIETDEQSVTVGLLLSVSRKIGPAAPRSDRTPARAVDDAKAIRAWAHANGHPVPARGRIPAPVREAYRAAH